MIVSKSPTDSRRIRVGKIPVDSVDLETAIAAVDALVRAGSGGTVFTPNVDHVVVGEDNLRFRRAYETASLSLVDGMPVLWAARLLGERLPMKISGSDLVLPVLQLAHERQYRVYFLGADPGVAELARDKAQAMFPGIAIVGVDSPRIELDGALEAITERVRAARPHLVLVALGAPKQEIFCHEHLEAMRPAVLFGIGASLDFLAGVKRRAPTCISNLGFEWLYRLIQEPRRLAYRYLVRDPRFVGIVLRQWRARPTST